MLTTAKLSSHCVPPLRNDGLRRGTTYCATQHLIVGLLQAAQHTRAILPRTTAIGNMLLEPLQHGWCANQHLRHTAHIASHAQMSNGRQRYMLDRLPGTTTDMTHG